jgi:hypothetical protein
LADQHADRAAATRVPLDLILNECLKPAMDPRPGIQVVEEFAELRAERHD